MEKTGFDNKLFKNMSEGLVNLTSMMTQSIDEAEKIITKDMDDKEKIRFSTFIKKHTKLIQAGDYKTAKELENSYYGK